jgi:hypothetical protein
MKMVLNGPGPAPAAPAAWRAALPMTAGSAAPYLAGFGATISL